MPRVNPWWTSEIGRANAINDLDDELAAERTVRHREALRFASEQAKVARHLEQVGSRIDSVTDQIGTVLAWTELRFQLLEFDEYQVRKDIRKVFRALAQGRATGLPEVDDIPGYWMPPAALAVLPLILREHHSADAAAANSGLASARERDALRTELFTLAVGRCFDLPALIEVAVPRLLSQPTDLGQAGAGHVAEVWRTLWKQAGLGDFGGATAAKLAGRLAAVVDLTAVDTDEVQAWDQAIESFSAPASTKAETFTALRAHLMAEPDHADAFAAREDQYWRNLLQELIEEPSPAERELIRVMDDLHLPDDAARRSTPGWGAAAGTVLSLLRHDLFDPNTSIPLRRLALQVSAPLLRWRLETALVVPEPVVTTVTEHHLPIEVTGDGHNTEQLAAVERAIATSYAIAAPSKAVGTAIFTGLAGLALVTLFINQWFLAIMFTLCALIPVWKYRTDRDVARNEAARRDQKLAEVHAELIRVRRETVAEDRRRVDQYKADREALDELLASLPIERI